MNTDEFFDIRIEDLHLDAEPPQVYLSHCKKEPSRYAPVLPTLAQELRTHLNGRRSGSLFETNGNYRDSARTAQSVVKDGARKAGIEERVYSHLLRHRIATPKIRSGRRSDRHRKPDEFPIGCNIGDSAWHSPRD